MINNLCSISMTDDDKYVIEVREEKKVKGNKKNGMTETMDEWKQYVAVDKKELHALIDKYIPNIKSKKEKDTEKYEKGWEKGDKGKGEEGEE